MQIGVQSIVRGALAAAVMASTVMMVTPVAAEEERDEGLEALRGANDAFDDGDYEEAYRLYTVAYDILGVSQIKYRMGQSAHEKGDARKAVDHYEAYLEIGDDEDFLGRIDNALPGLRESLITVVEVRSQPEGAEIVAMSEGEELARAEAPVTWEKDVKELVLQAHMEGYESAEESWTLDDHDRVEWDVELEAEEEVEPRISEEPVVEPSPEVDDGSSRTVMGWTSTGLGISVLAVGGVMTVLQSRATDDVNDFDRSAAAATAGSFAQRQELRSQQQSRRDDADNYHRAAMSAYVAGGVLTAAGLGLLMSDWLSSSDDQGGMSLDAGVGSDGGFLGIRGSF